MGLKLEIVIIVMIAAILSFTYVVKITHDETAVKQFTKELEFTDTTFTEVDTNKTQGVAFGKYGVRNAGILTVYQLKYHTENLKLLTANKGIYKQEKMYLDENISVHQKEGFDYYAEHAVYNKKTEILDITSPFTAMMNRNIVHGKSLRYNMHRKEAFATQVDAVVYTKEK